MIKQKQDKKTSEVTLTKLIVNFTFILPLKLDVDKCMLGVSNLKVYSSVYKISFGEINFLKTNDVCKDIVKLNKVEYLVATLTEK